MKLIVDGIIYENDPYGGVALVFSNILPLMCNLDQNLGVVLFFKKPPKIKFPRHKHISLLIYENLERFISTYFRPRRLWNVFYKDLVEKIFRYRLGNSKNDIWLSTYFSRPPEGWRGKEVVLVHDFIYERYPEFWSNSEAIIKKKKHAILSADKVFCNSKTTAMDLKKFYNVPDSDIVIAMLSHTALFKIRNQEIKTHIPYRYLLYVGKRKRHKDFQTLLDAFSKWEENQEIKLIVVGPAWHDEEKIALEKYCLTDKVVLYEKLNDDTLCDLYNQAEAFVYTSLYEGFGIPLLEAMACGCPVIASKIPSTEEVAGDAPIYFEPGNPVSLIAALNEMSKGVDLDDRKNRGLARVSQFSWEKTAKEFYSALNELFEKG